MKKNQTSSKSVTLQTLICTHRTQATIHQLSFPQSPLSVPPFAFGSPSAPAGCGHSEIQSMIAASELCVICMFDNLATEQKI